MHTTKIIKFLTLAASLAAGIIIVTGSEGAFAGCAPRDHRTVCDPNPPKEQPIQTQTTPPTVVAPTVHQGGQLSTGVTLRTCRDRHPKGRNTYLR